MNAHEYERAAREQAQTWRRDAERHGLGRRADEPAADALRRSVREARRDALAQASAGAPIAHRLFDMRARVSRAIRRLRPAARGTADAHPSIGSVDAGF